MPSRRRQDGTFRDIVHPLNSETRTTIEERVIQEFDKVKHLEPLQEPEVEGTSSF